MAREPNPEHIVEARDLGGNGGPSYMSGVGGPWTNGGNDHLVKQARDYAVEFMEGCGLSPTPDAIDQLVRVFLPCLKIMCERGYEPDGGTWRESGRLGALSDARKKFMRLWNQAWKHGRHDDKDHAFDCINFLGFYVRHDVDRWGEWGEPAPPTN